VSSVLLFFYIFVLGRPPRGVPDSQASTTSAIAQEPQVQLDNTRIVIRERDYLDILDCRYGCCATYVVPWQR